MQPAEPAAPVAPLEYRQAGAVRSAPIFSIFSFIACFVVLALIFAPLLFVAPRFEQIFKDFGTALPLLTVVLLNVSRFVLRIWWVCALLTLSISIAVGFVTPLLRPRDDNGVPLRRTTRRLTLATLVILFLGVNLAIVAFLLFLPMISLLQSVSAPSK